MPTKKEFANICKQFKEEIQETKKKLLEKSKSFFAEHAKILFDENPTLISFAWPQYAPNFNDGDRCYFLAHTSYYSISINDSHLFDDEEDSEINEETLNKKDKEKLAKSVSEFLKCFDNDILEDMFDEGKVIVFKNGKNEIITKVEYYEHE